MENNQNNHQPINFLANTNKVIQLSPYNKSISIKFINHLLQIPDDCPIQYSISKIKQLMMFKKQHYCCKSNKNQLKMLRNQVEALRNQFNKQIIVYMATQMNQLKEKRNMQKVENNFAQLHQIHQTHQKHQKQWKLKLNQSNQINLPSSSILNIQNQKQIIQKSEQVNADKKYIQETKNIVQPQIQHNIPTPYEVFKKQIEQDQKEENPILSRQDLNRLIFGKWEKLDPYMKTVYQTQHERLKRQILRE